VWARVAGDAADLAVLGSVLSSRRARRARAAVSVASVAAVTAADAICAQQLTRSTGVWGRKSVRAEDSILLENLPRFMGYLEAVSALDDRRSHWTARIPGERALEWDAAIVKRRSGPVDFLAIPRKSRGELFGLRGFRAGAGRRKSTTWIDELAG